MHDLSCATCGSLAEGFKCAACGIEQDEFEAGHLCGDEHLMPKCSICSEAETECNCDSL
ncbi:hypothetical protein HYW17_04710 [Candidatus Uhrbacteria bacterium]|nr:hypothetical protein [Candidatus Uhrbacteria bacterium]